jgi:GxxExxY protein
MPKNTEIELEFKELTSKIIACGIEVHKKLGPGFLESIYHNALLLELKKQGLKTESQKEIEICYDGEIIGVHRLDIVVENDVIIELKAVTAFDSCHKAQLLSYLKATGIKVGLLLNFAQTVLQVKRLIY